MMQIRTLNDLVLARAKYGVTDIRFHFDHGVTRDPAFATVMTATHASYGRGENEIEALDDAFFRLAHVIAAEVVKHAAGATRD